MKSFCFVLVGISIFLLSCGGGNSSSTVVDTNKMTSVTQNTVASDTLWMDSLKLADGKYAFDIKLFENDSFNAKLKAAVGEQYYTFIKETCSVQTPIQSNDSFFVLSACQAHNCASSNVLIILDYKSQKMYIDLFEDGTEHKYGDEKILEALKQQKDIKLKIS